MSGDLRATPDQESGAVDALRRSARGAAGRVTCLLSASRFDSTHLEPVSKQTAGVAIGWTGDGIRLTIIHRKRPALS